MVEKMKKEYVIELIRQFPDELIKISKISGYKIKQLIAIKAHITMGTYRTKKNN